MATSSQKTRSADLWLLVLTAVYLTTNFVFAFPWGGTVAHYDMFGRFAVASILNAIGIVILRIAGLRFSWPVVVLVMLLLALSFSINAHFLGAITGFRVTCM